MMMATSFRIESTVQGHHIFKDTWTPYINEELLSCSGSVEEGNVFDEHAVAVRRDERVVHKRHSKMICEITGHRHDSRYLSQIKGQSFEERSCTYIFEGEQNHI